MRLFIIDTSNMALELQGGLLGVEGSSNPTPAEKTECVETISQYVMDGWAIAADPTDWMVGRPSRGDGMRALRQPGPARRPSAVPKGIGLALGIIR